MWEGGLRRKFANQILWISGADRRCGNLAFGTGWRDGERIMTPRLDRLLSSAPAGDRTVAMETYGQFVGLWNMSIRYLPLGQPVRTAQGEWEFSYALEGRAVIDVWQVPPRDQVLSGSPTAECGLCVRIYDPGLDAWRFTFHGPVNRRQIDMVCRVVGDEIVQERSDETGDLRWIFYDIEKNRFSWRAERRAAGAEDWRIEQYIFAERQR